MITLAFFWISINEKRPYYLGSDRQKNHFYTTFINWYSANGFIPHTHTHTLAQDLKNVISFFPFLIRKEWMSPGFVTWKNRTRIFTLFNWKMKWQIRQLSNKLLIHVWIWPYFSIFFFLFGPILLAIIFSANHRTSTKSRSFSIDPNIRIYDRIYWSTSSREQTNTITDFFSYFRFCFI